MSVRQQSPLQLKLYTVIFGTETPSGKWFDISLIVVIFASVAIIMLDSIADLHLKYGLLFLQLEWAFTLLFSVEYLVRIWCAPNRKGYVFSLYGIVDLLALLPTFLALLVPQTAPLLIIRLLRILRIFRVMRMLTMLQEANQLAAALQRSARKVFIFFALMIILTTIFGCLLYVVEGPENGFDNIPKSIYWAIVTITTVGYGDIVPLTATGRAISAVGMLIGYAVIAVPTGIITAELTVQQRIKTEREQREARNCSTCAAVERDSHAHFCRLCGSKLPRPGHEPEPKSLQNPNLGSFRVRSLPRPSQHSSRQNEKAQFGSYTLFKIHGIIALRKKYALVILAKYIKNIPQNITRATQRRGLPVMHLNYKTKFATVLSTLLISSLSMHSTAQALLEEVVVTAQKREQNLQDVPVAVSAFSGEMLKQSGVKDMFQLSANAPSLIVQADQTSTSSTFGIRGIFTSSQNFGLESSVGLYVDGVYRARQGSMINNLLDVAGVEVLRGPQGTLFGRNTPAGAVTITSVGPDHEGTGFLEAGVGKYDLLSLSGAKSITLIDQVLAVRATGFAMERDGFIDIVGREKNKDDAINNRDRWGGRLQALYTPDEQLSVLVNADYSEVNELCCGAGA